jgi:uncharacterized protein YukE
MGPQYNPPVPQPYNDPFGWLFENIGDFVSRFCSAAAEWVTRAWQCTWGNTGVLNNKNTEWNTVAGEVKGASSNITGEVFTNVRGYWAGSAATAFLNYITQLSSTLDALASFCQNVGKGLATAASEVSKLRIAIVTVTAATVACVATLICAAAGTFGMTLAAIPPAIITWAVAVGAIIGAYMLFFNQMAQGFDDVEPVLQQLERMDTDGVAPAPPEVVINIDGWDINLPQ